MSPVSGSRVPAASESLGSVATTGLLIPITSTTNPGQDLDAADTTDVQGDEGFSTSPPMYRRRIWAANNDTVARELNLQWGGSGADYRVTVTLQPKSGAVSIVDGWLLKRGLAVTAWASASGVVNVKHEREPYRE